MLQKVNDGVFKRVNSSSKMEDNKIFKVTKSYNFENREYHGSSLYKFRYHTNYLASVVVNFLMARFSGSRRTRTR